MQFVPFVVLVMAAGLVLVLRPGRDILVPVFLMPWTGLTPDVGVQVPLAKVLFLLVLAKYMRRGHLWLEDMPSLPLLGAIVLAGWGAALVTLQVDGASGADFAVGEFRDGWLRVSAVSLNFVLSMLPFALFFAHGVPQSAELLIKAYVASVLTLCGVGVAQYAIYVASGVDILPLGLFQVDQSLQGSALARSVGGDIILRPNSFAVEPKNLGMAAASVIIIVMALGRELHRSMLVRAAVIAIALLTLLLTQSTSAFISLPVALAIYFGVRIQGKPLSSINIFSIYFSMAFLMMSVMLYRVAFDPEINNDWLIYANPDPTLQELIYERTIARFQVEDHDWAILSSMVADPLSLLIGRGFGLGHLLADPYIPQAFRYYMEGALLSPKTGVSFILANGGGVSLFLVVCFFVSLTPTMPKGVPPHPRLEKVVQIGQMMAIPIVILFFLRIYVVDIAILCLAIGKLATMPTAMFWTPPRFAFHRTQSEWGKFGNAARDDQ